MSDYTEQDVAGLHTVILDNFHPPSDRKPSWHIRPDEMARAVLDAVAPRIAARVEARAKAEALRELAEAMDGGFIDPDDLRYKTTDAPKGWLEACVAEAWESQLIWAPYLRYRADEIERGAS